MKKKHIRMISIGIAVVILVTVGVLAGTSFMNVTVDSALNSESVTNDNANVEPTNHGNDQNETNGQLPEPIITVSNITESEIDHDDVVDISAYTQKRTIGNILDVGLVSGMSAAFISDKDEKVSVRFTSKYSGDVTSIVTYFQQEGSFTPSLEVGLQADNGEGKPSGNWLSENAFGTTRLDRDGFIEIILAKPVEVLEGKRYHIVTKLPLAEAATPFESKIPMVAYKTDQPYLPLNESKLDRLSPDPALNTLHFDGKDWGEQNQWPLFVVKFSDGRSFGQPYSLAAPWIIHGPRHVGQSFVPSSTYLLEKFAFVINSKGGSQDDLYYQIKDSENKVISEGIFATKDTVGRSKQWKEMTLPSPIKLAQGKLYRIALFSPETAEPNSYQLYGHEFTYDVELGYGGSTQMLAASYSSGRAWEKWADADAIFRLAVAEKSPDN